MGDNSCKMEIVLMRGGYDSEDLEKLFEEPFSTYYTTRIGYEWQPHIAGDNAITISFIMGFILSSVAQEILSKITADIYDWSKKALHNVIKKKYQFEESRILILFEDICIEICVNNRTEIEFVLNNMDKILISIKNNKTSEKNIGLEYEDAVKLIK